MAYNDLGPQALFQPESVATFDRNTQKNAYLSWTHGSKGGLKRVQIDDSRLHNVWGVARNQCGARTPS
jgi:hypothetical protein